MTNDKTYSILLTGASGVGKSTVIRGALETFGSGAIVLAPGSDEADSYLGLIGRPSFVFKGFDDTLYQPSLGDKVATGHTDMVRWLKAIYLEVRADVDAGKPPRYAVLGIDTLSAVVGWRTMQHCPSLDSLSHRLRLVPVEHRFTLFFVTC